MKATGSIVPVSVTRITCCAAIPTPLAHMCVHGKGLSLYQIVCHLDVNLHHNANAKPGKKQLAISCLGCKHVCNTMQHGACTQPHLGTRHRACTQHNA